MTVKKKPRQLIAVSDCILLLFLGLVYAWSVLKKPLADAFAWNDNELTMCFTICMSFFCFGSLLAAKITKIVRHRTVVLSAGAAILAAFLLASRMNALWQLYLTYGVVVGFSVGAVYNCVLSTGNVWFKGKNGLMTGLFLMCFGAGSLLFGPLITGLMTSVGWSQTFVILGVLFFIVFAVTSAQVCMPGEEHALNTAGNAAENTAGHAAGNTSGNVAENTAGHAAGNTAGNAAGSVPENAVRNQAAAQSTERKEVPGETDFTTKEMLRNPSFWLFLLWSTVLSSVGLALVGQAATIAGTFGFGSMAASLTVGMVSASNGIGRMIFGTVYDKKERKWTMAVIAACSILGTLLLVGAIKSGSSAVLVAAFLFMSLGYGGITPTNSNFIRDFYGQEHYPVNFSIVNFNLLVSSFLGQYIGSSLYLKTGSYLVSAVVMLCICIAGFAIDFMLKRPSKKALI